MKTIFLSETVKSKNSNFLLQCPYIKYINGKWKEDIIYFNNVEELKKSKRGYIIK